MPSTMTQDILLVPGPCMSTTDRDTTATVVLTRKSVDDVTVDTITGAADVAATVQIAFGT